MTRAELARLEAAGWTVLTDSPWPRMFATVRRLAVVRRLSERTSR